MFVSIPKWIYYNLKKSKSCLITLIESYGYDKLYEIDKRSGWLSDQSTESNLEEYIERIKYEISICKEE